MKKRIWLFHLLNDFSGSPLVLKNTVLSLKDTAEVTICTSKEKGFLSNFTNVKYHFTKYQWNSNRILTLIRFFRVQTVLFWKVVSNRKQIDIVYINTLLPFGAALGAKLCGKKVIYHMHEPQISPIILFRFLSAIANRCSDKVIFVSEYLKDCFPRLQDRGEVVSNVLSEDFTSSIEEVDLSNKDSVLMLCSFKRYKGVYDFVELARLNPKIRFDLVLNSSLDSIKKFISINKENENLFIHPSTTNVHQYFCRAKVVLNLSHPESWIESFGMTALEAMAYGAPCIVPTVGGISELVTHDSGFRIRNNSTTELSKTINKLFKDKAEYKTYSDAARVRSSKFIFQTYKKAILNLV